MKSIHVLFVIVASIVFTSATVSAAEHGVDTNSIDYSVQPCKDLVQFANGRWMTNNPIPAERGSWDSFAELEERNLASLHAILDALPKEASQGSIAQKVGDFYRSGMDEAKIEREGIKPIQPLLKEIEGIKNVAALQRMIAHLHRLGIDPLFGFGVDQDAKNSTQYLAQVSQGGLGLPDRDYYLKHDEKMRTIRGQYRQHVEKMLQLAGDSAVKAIDEGAIVMKIETQLAKASMDKVELRNPVATYHKMSVGELAEKSQPWAWTAYFRDIKAPGISEVNVGQPEFIAAAARMTTDIPLGEWKAYLRWQVIHGTATRLSSDFVNENFHFYGEILTGAKELRARWKRMVASTDDRIGEGLGQIYAEKYFTPEAKQKALEMVGNLRLALRSRLQELNWIEPATRDQALRKLDAVMVKIGYPDKWRDYSALKISTDYVQNTFNADTFEFERNLRKIGKQVDRGEWQMSPPTVNAYYNPSMNEIVFPAGILQPPFYDAKADDACNYGAIGMVIGHEMTHGFDDEGHQFDAVGNLTNWWTDRDLTNFTQRAEGIATQYENYVVIDDLHINGHLSLGENIADIGGMKIAWLAFKKSQQGKPASAKIDGFTQDQRFFLAFAQMWHGNMRPEALRLQVTTNPHSPEKFRILGPIANMPAFYETFGCEMPKNSSSKSEIW